MLEPRWVGRRVSVRRVIEREPAGRLVLGDVVGDLLELDQHTAVLDTRAGLVEVPVALVTAARAAPPSTADELELAKVAARELRAAEVAELDGWLLQADHGFNRRANSVLPLGQLRRSIDSAVDSAADWYAARGLPLLISVPTHARRLLDAALAERGWPVLGPARVLARRVPRLADAASDIPVALDDAPDDGWIGRYRGAAARAPAARALLTRHDHVTFASVRLAGRTVAVGRGSVDGGWLGLTAVEVAPEHRRQGLATAVTQALWAWGARHGAVRSYLQVAQDNTAADSLSAKLGYWHHHDSHYRAAVSA